MTDLRVLRPRGLVVALLAATLMPSGAGVSGEIAIDLEWRPAAQTVAVGSSVEIGLYAVAEEDQQLFRALDMVFVWDPLYLDFDGVDGAGAASLLYSGFPTGDSYGLNEIVPPADGDGYYRAWAHLGAPITVTTAGVLLTTFEFTALELTPGTLVEIPASGGSPALETTVWGGPGANQDVTGSLGGAVVEIIIPEPGSLALGVVGLVLMRRRRRLA